MQFSQKSSIDISDSTHPLTDDTLPEVDYLKPDITNKYFVHFLCKTDSLQGIALFYHVTVPNLKKINKLSSDRHLYTRKYILIPKQPQNIHLEASLGTVIYPDPPSAPQLSSPVKMQPIKRSISVEPIIENHGWNTIDTTQKYSESSHSESYLQKLESAILQWYVSPVRQDNSAEEKNK
eukprot:NODE_348_length_10403_cov_0.608210.p5 type:complete len:179 gc:universal NODE_348_length_10403_cov_0.608210:8587-8051(-)